MAKVAIVVLADTETHEGFGRVFNALEAAKEFKDAQDDIQLIFDGAGTKWIVELSKPDHKAKSLFDAVRDRVKGACGFCAQAFGIQDKVPLCGVPLLEEFDGHPSFRRLVAGGYQIITF